MKFFKILILISVLPFISCSKGPSSLVNKIVSDSDVPEKRVYKEFHSDKFAMDKLEVHIFYPEGYDVNREEPYKVAAYFHGGGWSQGSPTEGYPYAKHFVSLGFVAVSFEYRLVDYVNVTGVECVKDVNSAIRWLRTYNKELNIDPDHIATVGLSAGGHLVIANSMFPDIIEEGEDPKISSIPNIVWAFAPPVSFKNNNFYMSVALDTEQVLQICPMTNIKPESVPVYIIHGNRDSLVYYDDSVLFVKKMQEAGNESELWTIREGKHSSFWENQEHMDYVYTVINDQMKKIKWIE